jgi:hypothetical protein
VSSRATHEAREDLARTINRTLLPYANWRAEAVAEHCKRDVDIAEADQRQHQDARLTQPAGGQPQRLQRSAQPPWPRSRWPTAVNR